MQEKLDWDYFVGKLDDAYSRLNTLELQCVEASANGNFAKTMSPKTAEWLQRLVTTEHNRRAMKVHTFPQPPFASFSDLELAQALFLSATLAESAPGMPGIETVSWLIHRIVLCMAIFELSKEESTDG